MCFFDFQGFDQRFKMHSGLGENLCQNGGHIGDYPQTLFKTIIYLRPCQCVTMREDGDRE